MAESFLDKVYDVYENGDFQYAQDNLNPVREVKLVDTTKSAEDEAYDIIRARLAALQDELNSITPDHEQAPTYVEASTNGESIPTGKTAQEVLSFVRTGADPDSRSLLGSRPGYDGSNILMDMVDNLIMQLSAKLNVSVDNPDITDMGNNIFSPSSLFNIDCNGVSSEISGLPDNDGNGGLALNEDGALSTGDKPDKDKEDNPNEDGDTGGSDIGTNPADQFGYNEAYERQQQLNQARYNQYNTQIMQCALMELEFLKVILIILQIIMVLKAIVSYAMNIAFLIIDIAQLAAGAWLNPTNIAKILQKVIGRVMAILQVIISEIIQMIWNMLNMDCISAQTVNYIQQIIKALAGINSIKSACNPDALKIQGEQLADAAKDLRASFNESVSRWKDTATNWDNLKASLGEVASLDKLKAEVISTAKSAVINKAIPLTSDVRHASQSAVSQLMSITGFNLLETIGKT